MAANVVDCTSADFQGLVNPYTGVPMDVKMVVASDGAVFFFAPDTYSTAQPFGTVAEAHRKWTRVDGVYGCRPDDEPARCAYTGELLVPHDDGSYSGGFDPTSFHTREDFLYFATMRGGKAKFPKPSVSRVVAPGERAPMPKAHEPDYVEGSLEAAGKVLKKTGARFQKRTVVTAGADLKRGK